jgi:hypothetical protein
LKGRKEKVERKKAKGERDHKAASDFSPGIFERLSSAEVLEREEGKGES